MRAVQITTHDGPGAVRLADVPDPVPAAGEALIAVRAAGVSFPEVLQTRGRYQLSPTLPFVPGSEVAGEVVMAPAGSGLAPGDRVAAFTMLGGFAELAAAPVTRVLPLPDGTSFDQGAALPLNYLTAWFALVQRGRMRAGESVLVQGAAGGVGTAAIQVARAFGAGTVIAVTSTHEKGAVALGAGADTYVLAESFKDDTLAAHPGGVDLVVDTVGDDRFTDSLRCLRDDGRLLVVGFTGGDIPSVKVNRLLLNNISVVGVGLGAYGVTRPTHVREGWNALLPFVENGALAPVIGEVFTLDQADQALRLIDDRRAVGKVLLRP
ncbi:NADPH:quinone oxidoreductase family protein [Longivirga aurantiaca]|uniref:NADPH:quinone oxidoreductase family protein n=1 Tax=Longivirga aurantiaca TaxID=1837743 RepID=A0ABW1T487_9ACTN